MKGMLKRNEAFTRGVRSVLVLRMCIYSEFKGGAVIHVSLAGLEEVRGMLSQRLLKMGGFGRGTMYAAACQCARPNCHSVRPDVAGHLQFRLLRKMNGKRLPLFIKKAHLAYAQAVKTWVSGPDDGENSYGKRVRRHFPGKSPVTSRWEKVA